MRRLHLGQRRNSKVEDLKPHSCDEKSPEEPCLSFRNPASAFPSEDFGELLTAKKRVLRPRRPAKSRGEFVHRFLQPDCVRDIIADLVPSVKNLRRNDSDHGMPNKCLRDSVVQANLRGYLSGEGDQLSVQEGNSQFDAESHGILVGISKDKRQFPLHVALETRSRRLSDQTAAIASGCREPEKLRRQPGRLGS